MTVTDETVDFKELCIDDLYFHKGITWKKIDLQHGKVLESAVDEDIGREKQFTPHCTVFIVI